MVVIFSVGNILVFFVPSGVVTFYSLSVHLDEMTIKIVIL